MQKHEMVTKDLMEKSKGRYIRLGGHGIIDGLRDEPTKIDLYEIGDIRISEHKGERCVSGVSIKRHRSRVPLYLPYHRWDQQCEIWTEKERKDLREYPWS